MRWVCSLLLACLLGVSTSVPAGCPPRDSDVDVAVGIRSAPPFINPDPILGNAGLALDLWHSVEYALQEAGRIGRTQLIECDLEDQLDALEQGALDIVISPLTITDERMLRFDFGVQYLSSGITVARKQADVINFRYAAGVLKDTISQPGIPRAIFFFLLFNLLATFVFALLLKNHAAYAGVISKEPRPVIWYRASLEAAVRSIGLHRWSTEYRSTVAKSFETLLTIIGTLLSAAIFGVLTTALISSIGRGGDISVGALNELRIATLNASTSQQFIEELHKLGPSLSSLRPVIQPSDEMLPITRWRRLTNTNRGGVSDASFFEPGEAHHCIEVDEVDANARCVTVNSWQAAMQLLARDEVDVVIGDWAQLTFLARSGQFGRDIYIQSDAFRVEPYGWGFSPQRPELRAMIDQDLMMRIRHPEWRGFVQSYLGGGSIGAN